MHASLMLHMLVVPLCFLVSFSFADEESNNSVNNPNILLILADDVGTGDIPFYWNEKSLVQMPNLKRLASQGVKFTDAHSTPLCAPSRYMLLSGNYAQRGFFPMGSWNLNVKNENQFMSYQKSIAEVLKTDANYETAMFGKWHMGGGVPRNQDKGFMNKTHVLSDPRHDWTRQMLQGPQDIGFDTSYISVAGIQKHPYVFFRNGFLSIDQSDAVFWPQGSYPGMSRGTSIINKKEGEGAKDWDSSAYNMIVVDETAKFIDDHLEKNENKPFFAYVALGAVHEPHSPPKTYLDGDKIEGVYPTKHLDMLLEMDKVVGSLVSIIEEKNLGKETIIIFASDNGGLGDRAGTDAAVGHESNGPLRGSKGMVYEGGHRIPLIIRYDDNFPQNEERSRIVGLNDLYATICELIGISVPYLSAQDSISFAEYMKDGSKHSGLRQDLAVWDYQGNKMRHQSMRVGNMKLVHQIPTSTFELYDLDTDLYEENNLFNGDGEYDTIMNEMYAKLLETGPCPMDKTGSFTLSGGNENGLSVTCDWFRESTNRCSEHIEGRLHCNSVCANAKNRNFCKRITFPVSPTIPLCQDSKNTFLFEGKRNSCKSITPRASSVCRARIDIKVKCPVACGDACQCYNTPGSFKVNKRKRTCNFVAKKKLKRCRKLLFHSHCPKVCAQC